MQAAIDSGRVVLLSPAAGRGPAREEVDTINGGVAGFQSAVGAVGGLTALHHAVRQGDWKYLQIAGSEHLFELGRDPFEKEDLAASQPEILQKLRGVYAEWEQGMLPPIEPVKPQ